MSRQKKQTRIEATITWPNLKHAIRFNGHLVEIDGPVPTDPFIGGVMQLKIDLDEPIEFIDNETLRPAGKL